jgi:hypothetical protein
MDPVVEKIVAKAETSAVFNDDEVKALKAMAKVWQGLETLGRIAGVIRGLLTYLTWAAAFYAAFKLGLADYLKGVIAK